MSSSLFSRSSLVFDCSSSSFSSPPKPWKVSSKSDALSSSPLLKVGGYFGFFVFSLESLISSRVVRTNSSNINTTIQVGVIWFFSQKYGRVSLSGINPIALAKL